MAEQGERTTKGIPILIWVTAGNRFYRPLIQRRDNLEYRLSQARRYEGALRHEGIYKYVTIRDGEYRNYRDWLTYYKLRCKSFPTSEGTMIVVSDRDFGTLDPTYQCGYLPAEAQQAVLLIANWIRDMPKGRNAGGTRGLGGTHAGRRHKRHKPGEYVPIVGTKEDVLDSFKCLPTDIASELTPGQRQSLALSLRHKSGPDFTLLGLSANQVGRVLACNGLLPEHYIPNLEQKNP